MLDIYLYLLTQVNLYCTPCHVPGAGHLQHTCTEDHIRGVLLHPITDVLYQFLLRVASNVHLIESSVDWLRRQVFNFHNDVRVYINQPGFQVLVRSTPRATTLVNIYNYLLAQENRFCLACNRLTNE